MPYYRTSGLGEELGRGCPSGNLVAVNARDVIKAKEMETARCTQAGLSNGTITYCCPGKLAEQGEMASRSSLFLVSPFQQPLTKAPPAQERVQVRVPVEYSDRVLQMYPSCGAIGFVKSTFTGEVIAVNLVCDAPDAKAIVGMGLQEKSTRTPCPSGFLYIGGKCIRSLPLPQTKSAPGDLPGADLPGADLPGADLPGADQIVVEDQVIEESLVDRAKRFMSEHPVLTVIGAAALVGVGYSVYSRPRSQNPYDKTHELPDEVVNALRQFRAAEGRNWKSKLRSLWASGKDEGALRWARNILGPSGLDRVRL